MAHDPCARASPLSLLLVLAAAAVPASSSAAAPCASDEDCQLNGHCVDSACACFPPWTGSPDCSTLALLPVPKPAAYGWAPNLTSWGGNIVRDPDTPDLYHLFVAEMANGCGLDTWHTNSLCRHAVASSPTGPFEAKEVAVGAWCHNPQVLTYKDPGTGAVTYALFHIGDGVPAGNVENCTAAADPFAPPLLASPHTSSVAASASSAAGAAAAGAAAKVSTVHISSSLNGPWTPLLPSPVACNNPSPMQHPNGTLFLLCANGALELYTSPSLLGPGAEWRLVTKLNTSGGVVGSYEDPFLWLDPSTGFWHALSHVYDEVPYPTCANTTVSAHLFSRDGLTWRAGATQPYGSVVRFTDGSTLVVPTRERPKLLFDPSTGRPTHLINGACGGWDSCLPNWCSHCKIEFWDFTLVQPLALN